MWEKKTTWIANERETETEEEEKKTEDVLYYFIHPAPIFCSTFHLKLSVPRSEIALWKLYNKKKYKCSDVGVKQQQKQPKRNQMKILNG